MTGPRENPSRKWGGDFRRRSLFCSIDSEDADELLRHLGAPHFDSEGRWREHEGVSEEESRGFWNRGIWEPETRRRTDE
jgi:hypothetical protein